MKYSIARIFHNLHKNYLIYLAIMFNFMLGAGFFVICMNFKMTSQELLQESKRQSSEGVIPVNISGGITVDLSKQMEDYPITYDTYRRLSEDKQYKNELEMLFTMEFYSTIHVSDPAQFFGTHVYFMNENLFTYLYGFSRTKNTAYLGKNAYQTLLTAGEALKTGGDTNLAYLDVHMSLDNGKLIFGDKSYPYEIVTPTEQETIMYDRMGEPGYDMADAVILPIEDVSIPPALSPELFAELRNILFFHYCNENWREDLVAQELSELNTENKIFSFQADNAYLELKGKMDDLSYDMDRWMILSVSIMMLSGIGCVGTMFLFLDKRRHFLAISIAYGSTFGQIVAETLTEVFIVMLSGGLLGILASPVLKKVLIYKDELKVNAFGIITVIMIAFLFSVLSVLLGMYAVKVKDVAVTLKDE